MMSYEAIEDEGELATPKQRNYLRLLLQKHPEIQCQVDPQAEGLSKKRVSDAINHVLRQTRAPKEDSDE